MRSVPALLFLSVLAGCGGATPTVPPPASVATLTLNQAAATLTPTQTVTLVATTKDASGNPLNGRTITWASNASAVATVSGGLVTAVSVGTAMITATSEGHDASATITVAAVVIPVATVTLSQGSASLVPGQTVTLIATPRDASGNTLTSRGITWSSTATGFATVDGNGVVSAVATGSATITATSEGQNASAVITIMPGAFLGPAGGTATAFGGNATVTIPAGALNAALAIVIAQITNPQADPKLAPGTGYDFGPTGTAFASPVTLSIRYDPALLVAGTNQSQLRLHKLVGTTWTPLVGSTVNTVTHVVTGVTSSFSAYAVLEVVIAITSITITPNPVDLPLSMQVQLTATPRDAQGNALTGRVVSWGSSLNGIASISPTTGLVTSVAIGATVVSVTSEGVSAQMTLNVRSDPSTRTLSVYKGSGSFYVPGIGIYVIPSLLPTVCAIGTNQRGYCWGSSPGGAVGDGTLLDRSVPTAIALGSPLMEITVGGGFGCALDTTHNAWCWGTNYAGAWGNGGFVSSPTPISAGGGRQFLHLGAGNFHVCGIDLLNATYCWGRNDLGALGIGFISPQSSSSVTTPTRLTGDPGLVSISVGPYGACGLTSTGAAYCWGAYQVQFGHAPDLSATLVPSAPAFANISHGTNHRCGVSMSRQLYCWGENDYGQLGDGTTARKSTPLLIAAGTGWRSVSAGNLHTCGVTTDNRTLCWGATSFGEGATGNGNAQGSPVPVQISGGAPPFAVVSAGVESTCGLTADGTGYCWGRRGALGDGDYLYGSGPVQVAGAQNAVDLARGSPLGCYVNSTKQLFCWAETESQTSAQVPSFGSLAVKAVASAVPGFSCVILETDSRISCWGDNGNGQLGNGSTVAAAVPTPISSVKSFTSLALAYAGGCGISTQNELMCWGRDGFTPPTPTPVQVLPGITWSSVWGGTYGSVCAISSQGQAYCGPLVSVLALVPGPQHWVMMAPGNFSSSSFLCGLSDAGDAYCMGDNTAGQLGDGTTITRAAMVPVAGGLKFTQIVNARTTTCGLTALPAGAAYCWGDGTGGQMGSAPAISSSTPVLIPGGLHFTKLSGGPYGICGVTTSGLVYCWGIRYTSSLGNGELDDRRTPVPMSGGLRFLLYEPGTVGLRALRAKLP